MSRPAVPRSTSGPALPVRRVTVGFAVAGVLADEGASSIVSVASLSAGFASVAPERAEAPTTTGPAAITARSIEIVLDEPTTSRVQTSGCPATQPGPRSVLELTTITFGEKANVTWTPVALPARFVT